MRRMKSRSTDNVDWDIDTEFEGRVVDRGEAEINKKPRTYLTIDTGLRLIRIFESKALEDLFKHAEPGDMCRIVHHGLKQISDGKTFRRFEHQLWEGE